jgi:hypothetical protein
VFAFAGPKRGSLGYHPGASLHSFPAATPVARLRLTLPVDSEVSESALRIEVRATRGHHPLFVVLVHNDPVASAYLHYLTFPEWIKEWIMIMDKGTFRVMVGR